MTSNKNSNNFNYHPEMNDGYSFSNNEIPKTIQQLLSMQGSNSKKINTESENNFLFKINKSYKKSFSNSLVLYNTSGSYGLGFIFVLTLK